LTVPTLRLATRGSRLALWQAHAVADLLASFGTVVEIVTIRTSGDRLQERPLSETGTKNLFVKELEDAMLRGDADLAVHSAKDLPATLPDGLEVAATLPRDDPRDALVLPAGAAAGDLAAVLAQLGEAPTVATSSVRREAQLRAILPQAAFVPIRGNVDTRIRKLDEGGYHALVLAAAGMRRLGVADRISAALPIDVCVPAPGQGIVAVEIRSGDTRTREALQKIDDRAAGVALDAERALVNALGGGCQLPLGAIAVHDAGELDMQAIVLLPEGGRALRARIRGAVGDPDGLGRRVAEQLVSAGALEVLDEVRRRQ
jgi:hydroxymethylbilane synthase